MDEEKGKPISARKPVVVKSKKSTLIPAKTQPRKTKLSGKKTISKSGGYSPEPRYEKAGLRSSDQVLDKEYT